MAWRATVDYLYLILSHDNKVVYQNERCDIASRTVYENIREFGKSGNNLLHSILETWY
jgi:hypothetical protein